MALFYECMERCAHIVLDIADVVRDGDFSPAIETHHTAPGHYSRIYSPPLNRLEALMRTET